MLDYFLFIFVAFGGVLQMAAAHAKLRGILFFKKNVLGYICGGLAVGAAIWWFFTTANRNTLPSLNGGQQILLFASAGVAALLFTLAVSSITKMRMSTSGETSWSKPGLEALKELTYLKVTSHSFSRPTQLILGLLALSMAVVFFFTADKTPEGQLENIFPASLYLGKSPDIPLFLYINGLAGKLPLLDRLMKGLVNDYFVPVSLGLSFPYLWFGGQTITQRERNQRAVLCGAIGLGIANLAVSLLNNVYFWPRPFLAGHLVNLLFYSPGDPSFPSNPAAVGFAVATAIWLGNRRVGAILYSLAVLFSLARIYCGICYPLDVAAGALIGFLSSYIIFRVLPLIEPLPTLFLRLGKRLYLA